MTSREWWQEFQAEHEDWRFADREALFDACWQASRAALIAEIKEGGAINRGTELDPLYRLPDEGERK
jgi:hypothetical protein